MNQSLIGLKISGKENGSSADDKIQKFREGVVIDTYNSPRNWEYFYFVCVDSSGKCFLLNQTSATIDMSSLRKIIKRNQKLERDIEEIKNRFELLDIREES